MTEMPNRITSKFHQPNKESAMYTMYATMSKSK